MTLRVTTVQTNLYWEEPEENLAMFDEKLAPLKGKTDLIVLPEMFTTGFSMNVGGGLAEGLNRRTVQWMADQAEQLGAVVIGSFMSKEDGNYFNRLVVMYPDGAYQYYDKRHLFALAGEHKVYTPGRSKLIIEWKGWRIFPLICYDLRFPAWSRNTTNYDLLLYVANWPRPRAYHWKSLLVARAIENQVYTVGVNRVGTDAANMIYSGDTMVIDYAGEVLYTATDIEDVSTTTLSLEKQQIYREKLPFLQDADRFEVINI